MLSAKCTRTSFFPLYRNKKKDIPRICVATASIDKFREAAHEAGLDLDVNPKVVALQNMPTRYIDMNKGEDWEKIIREKVKEIEPLK